ncbi:hypothetical protein [Roseofilum casamattae]|uniref:Uncharacterized protein n=1 Tax=Roseofilum casamattae BLCC-M143 TaxID=3022442 RepID=A0ABT7BT32_9CYAN|nr:hypothetical protein [Roseofilum casamattae]MDJ1182336.1 hypothetical protein [Roseofilum casamattae BLCC-M143]
MTISKELQQIKLIALQQDIQLGIDNIEVGQYTTYTEDTAKELVAKVRAKGHQKSLKRRFLSLSSETIVDSISLHSEDRILLIDDYFL